MRTWQESLIEARVALRHALEILERSRLPQVALLLAPALDAINKATEADPARRKGAA